MKLSISQIRLKNSRNNPEALTVSPVQPVHTRRETRNEAVSFLRAAREWNCHRRDFSRRFHGVETLQTPSRYGQSVVPRRKIVSAAKVAKGALKFPRAVVLGEVGTHGTPREKLIKINVTQKPLSLSLVREKCSLGSF